MLSEKTIAEMKAGARCLAEQLTAGHVDPDYMAAMIRTQERAKCLRELERDGKIIIEQVTRRHTNVNKVQGGDGVLTYHVIRVGKLEFRDEIGEMTGAWPSEVLVAQIVLALQAGQGEA